MREAVRIDALALDQPGIAEGGFEPRLSPVDEEHRAAALLQVKRDRHADDPGAENDNIHAHARLRPFDLARPLREWEARGAFRQYA